MGHLSARLGREETNWRSDVAPNTDSQQWRSKIERDLYEGNGPARSGSIISRINALEASIDVHAQEMDRMEEVIKGINGKFWAIVLGMLMILAGLSVDIAKGSFQQGQRSEAPAINETK